ncbi:hypothetical protein HKX48_004572 [Thoreauomyces humboldtii]|nr:hypothetical protein HKX48_004572 [Thoreauomyces humboldtii]
MSTVNALFARYAQGSRSVRATPNKLSSSCTCIRPNSTTTTTAPRPLPARGPTQSSGSGASAPPGQSRSSRSPRAATEHVEHLPTPGRWTVRPRRRPLTGAIDLSGTTVAALHDAFRRHDIRSAWQVYKNLFRHDLLNTLHPDDHTAILGWLTTHTLPLLAALHAARVMENMRRLGHRPDLRDYHAVMLCHLRNSDPRRCVLLFDRMVDQDHVRPDARAFTLLLAAYGHAQEFHGLWATWNRMERECPGARADMDAWAVMLDGCGACGRTQEAVELYEELRHALPAGRRIDRKVVEAMIKVRGQAKQLGSALQMFRDVKDGNAATPIDLETYDAVLQACVAADDPETAMELWEELADFCSDATAAAAEEPAPAIVATANPSSPSDPIANRSATAVVKRPTTADPIVVVPLATTYTLIIGLLSRTTARKGGAAQIVELFKERDEHYPPDAETHAHVVWALLKSKDHVGALAEYDAMVRRGHMPDAMLVMAAQKARKMVE